MAKTRKPKLSDYQKKLLDPRWQRRRLEVLEAADWRCQWCGAGESTLHVHHGYYRRKADPWDYDDEYFHVLCDKCHGRAEAERADLYRVIGLVPPSRILRLHEIAVGYAAECLPVLVEERAKAPSEPDPDEDLEYNREATEDDLKEFFGGLRDFLNE